MPSYTSPPKLHYWMASNKRRDTQQYWEERLKRMHLGADAGRPIWLSYGHDVTKLDTDGRKTYTVTGEPERGEWPLSLLQIFIAAMGIMDIAGSVGVV